MPHPSMPRAHGLALFALVLAVAGSALAQRRPSVGAAPAITTQPSADAEATARAALAELTGVLYAPPSSARDLEMAALLARYVDFEELTRRFFGEPCPAPGCVDHWAELTIPQRIEVEGLVQQSLTELWTQDLSHALDYDVDLQAAVSHRAEGRVRATARPKTGSAPTEIVDLFYVPARAPYRAVDVTASKDRLAARRYKIYDKWLTNRDQGYPYLVARLGKKKEREAAAPPPPAVADAAPTASAEPDASEPPDTTDDDVIPDPPPPPPPPPPGVAWWKIALGAALLVAIGVALGRRGRKGT